jgi:hypothetical protein
MDLSAIVYLSSAVVIIMKNAYLEEPVKTSVLYFFSIGCNNCIMNVQNGALTAHKFHDLI